MLKLTARSHTDLKKYNVSLPFLSPLGLDVFGERFQPGTQGRSRKSVVKSVVKDAEAGVSTPPLPQPHSLPPTRIPPERHPQCFCEQ